MDYKKDTDAPRPEKEILFSQAVKAGKRIYYLDVKCSKRNELYLCVTESKKIQTDDREDGSFNFEKHKIFLYQEDFSKFIEAFSNAVSYIHAHNSEYDLSPFVREPAAPADASARTDDADAPDVEPQPEVDDLPGAIDIDIEF